MGGGAWEEGRDVFNSKLMELKFQGSSCAWAPSKAIEGALVMCSCGHMLGSIYKIKIV